MSNLIEDLLPETSVIQRRSLHDELVDLLRELIVKGDLEPGMKVPEQNLAKKFGVSRTPLREALKVLASEGLITLTPNKGATISALTLEDLEEAFPVMGALEALSGEMACQRISDKGIADIRKLHNQMVVHYKAGEMPEYFCRAQTMASKGLVMQITKAPGALFLIPSPTAFMTFRLMPKRSSRLIPGFLGTPAVTIITSASLMSA